MSFLNVKNRAKSRLASAITDSDLSLTVTAGDGDRFPASNFHITIEDEILLCTSRIGDTLTVVRAKEETSAILHPINAKVQLRITAQIIEELQNKIDEAFVPENLSSQCDGSNTVFTIVNDIGKILWLSLGGGLLIIGLDFNKTDDKEITLIGKYASSPPETGEELYIHYIKK